MEFEYFGRNASVRGSLGKRVSSDWWRSAERTVRQYGWVTELCTGNLNYELLEIYIYNSLKIDGNNHNLLNVYIPTEDKLALVSQLFRYSYSNDRVNSQK